MDCHERSFASPAALARRGAPFSGRSGSRIARGIRRAAVLALAAAGFAAAAAPASASTYLLRPAKTIGTYGSAWSATPQTSTLDSVLAKPVTQPAAPDTSSYATAPDASSSYWWWDSLGEQVAAAPALSTGESVTSATAWVYLGTGAYQSVALYLASGYQPLANTTIAAGKQPGWYSVSTQKALTPTDLGQLTIWLSPQGPTNMSYTRAYAAYIELDTSVAATPPAPHPATPVAPPAPAPLSNLVSLTAQTVALSPKAKSVPVTLSCPASTVGGCHGTLTLTLMSPAPGSHSGSGGKAKVSRCARGCRVLGHANFDILAGRRKHVKVHLAHSASALFRSHSSVHLEATTITRDGAGHTQTAQSPLTIKRARPGHPGAKRQRPASGKRH